jgi:hypothetical protein
MAPLHALIDVLRRVGTNFPRMNKIGTQSVNISQQALNRAMELATSFFRVICNLHK